MNVARPAGGFKIVVAPNVRHFVDRTLPQHPELPRHWQALIVRLKATAHLDGEAVDGNAANRAGTFQPIYNGPLFKLAWRVLGDTVTIVLADF